MAQSDKLQELATALVRIDWAEFPLTKRLKGMEEALGGGLAGVSPADLKDQFKEDLANKKDEIAALVVHSCETATAKTPQGLCPCGGGGLAI